MKKAPIRLLVTGSRTWTDEMTIRNTMTDLNQRVSTPLPAFTLVTGACPDGADAMALEIAKELNWDVDSYPADWDTYGRTAGFRRNIEMVESHIALCYAFVMDESSGTTHCLHAARWRKIPTTVWYRYSVEQPLMAPYVSIAKR